MKRFSKENGFLMLVTLVATVMAFQLGLKIYQKGIRGNNYHLAFAEIMAVLTYGFFCKWLKPALQEGFPRLKGYLVEKPGSPYILGFVLSLLIAALFAVLKNQFLVEQIANISYFMLVVGVVLELKAALRERKAAAKEEGSSK